MGWVRKHWVTKKQTVKRLNSKWIILDATFSQCSSVLLKLFSLISDCSRQSLILCKKAVTNVRWLRKDVFAIWNYIYVCPHNTAAQFTLGTAEAQMQFLNIFLTKSSTLSLWDTCKMSLRLRESGKWQLKDKGLICLQILINKNMVLSASMLTQEIR